MVENVDENVGRILQQLKENQSQANCSSTHSSSADMHREMDMEDLEDEIKSLEKQLAG